MKTNNKCREALELCIDELCNRCRVSAASQGNPLPCLTGCETVRKAKAALASPLKNCEIGTAEEQSIRFIKFCDGYGCGNCPLVPATCCELAWGQLPYVE